jgi:hypothetical protein
MAEDNWRDTEDPGYFPMQKVERRVNYLITKVSFCIVPVQRLTGDSKCFGDPSRLTVSIR